MRIKSNLLVLCALSLVLSACSDRFTVYYPQYSDAVKDGAIVRGWIPTALPSTATEIHEQHDIDTNNVWIQFSLSNTDKEQIISGLKKLTEGDISQLELCYPKGTNWWFEDLIQKSPANDNALYAEIYSVIWARDGSPGYLAVDRTTSKVYYWCTK